ncbi:unnamed protein product, partial [Lepidochelys kempii]
SRAAPVYMCHPICLKYFTESVTLECGHNFCQALSAEKLCNRETRQLANVVEIAKQLSFQAAKGTVGDGVCETHQEALKLFCEEDQTPICVICRESWAYCAHMVVPIPEATQKYK